MNYLAHSVLSFNQTELIIGNFIADSLRGNKFEGLTKGIIDGVILHRKIDSFTDVHPTYLLSKHKFTIVFPRYSGVITDIIYDHFLAKNFNRYVDVSLQQYAFGIYELLKENEKYLPEPAKRFLGYMSQRNILFSYSSITGIETVFIHLTQRIKNRYELSKAIPVLMKNYDELENEFFVFFEELRSYAKAQLITII